MLIPGPALYLPCCVVAHLENRQGHLLRPPEPQLSEQGPWTDSILITWDVLDVEILSSAPEFCNQKVWVGPSHVNKPCSNPGVPGL